ncbi:hypothetical protein KM043_000301 [Ampulex compressa]|nr:hypothetical protein KM043_000301 [Ampulex compressa]
MSRNPSRTPPGLGDSPTGSPNVSPSASPKDSPDSAHRGPPRGSRLRDRVSFFEQVCSGGRTASADELLEEIRRFRPASQPRTSPRASDSSFEESFERLVEEGELNGARVVKFEKITVRKSVREVGSLSGQSSRTPSEERALEDSAYQSHNHGAQSHGSKSSSAASFARFPSEESLWQRRGSSPQRHLGPEDRAASSEWYAEFRAQTFQNVASRIECVRSRTEYDAHIAEIRDEQERVQKKTFVNWINSYLAKRIPPMRVDDLIDDLKDGTRLLALLEVLSGEKLPVEKGRNLKRPHFLSNANTALQFLQSKKIKLVNINSSDLVDGRPPVVLGLIWTIILYFQIEENTRALEYLGHAWGSQSSLESLSTQGSMASERKRISSEKWKQGARKTLLQWVTNALPKDVGIQVRDFGESWRDGNAFLAIIDAIKANLVSRATMSQASNRARLETAFYVAEAELGIARLLDPEDVDVPQPDEKSIMTYVAQFLHKYPEPGTVDPNSFSAVQRDYDELLEWLTVRIRDLEQLDRTKAYPTSYAVYLAFKIETEAKSVVYGKLQHLVETSSMIGITRESWRHVQALWTQMETLMLRWLCSLDSALPGELGEVGRWLCRAEALLASDGDIPEEMTEETANIISNKLEEHKKFFLEMAEARDKLERARASEAASQVRREQLDDMAARLEGLPSRAAKRRIRLKFLEHKCCLVAFLFLVETKLKSWGVKYGSEEKVHEMLEQYRNFVSRNRIFQEFQKAYLDMQRVVEEYKREANVDPEESSSIDRFMRETGEKWKNVSMDLRCVQSMLEEVVAYWRRWNLVSEEFAAWLRRAEPAMKLPEEERMEFFQDISVWKEKHQQLGDTVGFLIATSDEPVALGLKERHSELSSRWEALFQEAKQYMHAGDLLRNRKEYRLGVERLQKWLRAAEDALSTTELTSTERIKAYGESLQALHNEVEGIEELFKQVSKKFQTLIQDLSRDEVDRMMNTLKREKEALVRVRALIPMQLHLYHQLLVQQESLEAGQREIAGWLDEAERLLASIELAGGRDAALGHLDRHRAFFSRTLYYKSMLDSKNKVFANIVKSVDGHAEVERAEGGAELRALNERFARVSQAAQHWEQRLQEAVRCWTKFKECERQVSDWLSVAETLVNDRLIDDRRSIEYHKEFFGKVNERWIQELVNAGQDLRNALPAEQQRPVLEAVEALQRRWKEVLSFAPLHLMRLEFRLDEATFLQYLKEIEVEVNSEQQALMKNDDAEAILRRNEEFFAGGGLVPKVEKCLQSLKQVGQAYRQLRPNDGSLAEAAQRAERAWEESAQRVERLREQLRQVPQQWAAYREKFDRMVRWMDDVDATLRTILHEVNTLEEFEEEKTIFQKISREADGKREEMKWLVQTLDSLTSNRSDREALAEQSRLEQLIARYKNLIPTIEITMTKTDIYSKSYTYRKEVREVCTLLRKVREQSKAEVPSECPERLKEAVAQQESHLGQLEQQRANIVSMLQRGKDLLKDQHAPPFVSSEVQQLEASWNDTYGQSVEALKCLRSSHKLWSTYREQREEASGLIERAEEEARRMDSASYREAAQVATELQSKQQLAAGLGRSAEELLRGLRETYAGLSETTPPERREILRKEIERTEKRVETSLRTVRERVVQLQEQSGRWNRFQARLNELQSWTRQSGERALAEAEAFATPPEERIRRIESLQREVRERSAALRSLEEECRELVEAFAGGEGPKKAEEEEEEEEERQPLAEMAALRRSMEALRESVAGQQRAAAENLATWKEYEEGLRNLRPWIERAEQRAGGMGSKPSSLAQASEMLETARAFEVQCQAHLPRIQDLSSISQRIAGRSSAPDEVDAVHTRWNAIHDVALQTTAKLEKLVASWNGFESEAKDFEEWLRRGEAAASAERGLERAAEPSKLESELARLRELNKDVSDHQAQLISLTQVSDHIGHGLSIEGASALKARVSELKARIGRLAECVRLRINRLSDGLLARQEFQMRIGEFEDWMARMRANVAESAEVNVEDVEAHLQAVHAYLQEHSEKQASFASIYEEVKRSTGRGALGGALEAGGLEETYASLARRYKGLEEELRGRKRGLEKWAELLSWLNDANARLSHCKYEAEARKPTIADIERLSAELEDVGTGIESWRREVAATFEGPAAGAAAAAIRARDKQGKSLSASMMIGELEARAGQLRARLEAERDRVESLTSKWESFGRLQQALTEEIVGVQGRLQEATYGVGSCEQLAPAIERIGELTEELRRREPEREALRREGEALMKEDQRATTNVQVALSSVEANWEKVAELLREQRRKYAEMEAEWAAYREARQRLDEQVEEARGLCRARTAEEAGAGGDATRVGLALEKHRRALEVLKRAKQFLERMDSRAQLLAKEASLMASFDTASLEAELAAKRAEYREAYARIAEETQAYEARVIGWKQIEDSRAELARWLASTSEALASGRERPLEPEQAQSKLARYAEELPGYRQMRQGIAAKTEQLVKLNGGVAIPTLVSLNRLLDEQFEVLAEAAERLRSLSTAVEERQRAIRAETRACAEAVSKIREEVIKCDDLTGENVRILARIKRVRELTRELEEREESLAGLEASLREASGEYPSIGLSSLPKEVQALRLRKEAVSSHASKVCSTLVAFLSKLYHESFGALQRMVATHREKVAWCEPERSSDRYNLEVKLASLADVAAGIGECAARRGETERALELLASVEGPETMAALRAESERVAGELAELEASRARIGALLEENVSLWRRYEASSESVASWLKEREARIRAEASSLPGMAETEARIRETEEARREASEYGTELAALAGLAEEIGRASPESRVGQYTSHLRARHEAVLRLLSQQLERLRELRESEARYAAGLARTEAWLEGAEARLRGLEEVTGPRPMSFYQARLRELRAFGEEREAGQAMASKTAEAAEALFAGITAEDREAIRSHLRDLRGRVDGLADRANAIQKRVESDMMHRSSFEDKYSQVKQWLAEARAKVGDGQELLPSLQEKKLALQLFRTIGQDVAVHENILRRLREKLGGAPDDEASEMLEGLVEGYERLAADLEERIGVTERHVANHEAYLQSLEGARDWTNALLAEAAPILEEFSAERDTARSRIGLIENVLRQREEAERGLEDCNRQLNMVLEQTSLPGHPALLRGLEQQRRIWREFVERCSATRERLAGLCERWAEFERLLDDLEGWIRRTEARLKDQSLRSTAEAKWEHLRRLRALEEEIAAKEAEVSEALERGQRVEAEAAESELAGRLSRQATRYKALRNQAKEAVARYEEFAKEHAAFDAKYEEFAAWIAEARAELVRHSEIVGDLAILQSRQRRMREVADARTRENARFESVVDLGEKLYVHTSPEGREIVRQRLKELRKGWEGFSEELQAATQRLDQCLTQFAEFLLSQEQLTGWLRDVERAMRQHTELKCSLEEKRAQLQNHRIMHQEITSHRALVEAVCERARQLVDRTKDSSLNVYLSSIEQLFESIVAKSGDLLENLEDCAEKHRCFQERCKHLSDWLALEREKLAECNELSGERADIARRMASLGQLERDRALGCEQLAAIRELAEAAAKGTAARGRELLERELAGLEEGLRRYAAEIGAAEERQRSALERWQDFEELLESQTAWFQSMEAAFRDQQARSSLQDKEAQLRAFRERRELVLKREPKIDEFVDRSHGLLHASGIERIKPLVSQISNRYQQLLVLSKEAVTRNEAIVEDHRAYEERLKAVEAWLRPLEESLSALREEEAEERQRERERERELGRAVEREEESGRASRLQALLAEREQAEHRLSGLTSMAERILADTSAQGREVVRYELRNARERWDRLAEGIAEQQKRQEARSLQWSSYREALQQTLAWLESTERNVGQDSAVAWSSLQEIRAKLLKSKATHQEVLAHKRTIEALSEKANALVRPIQGTPSEAQRTVALVAARYDELVDASQRNISGLEALLDTFQQLHDLQKSYQDYQKQQWELLANYSDYTGNKAALQARLARIVEIQDAQGEGELKLTVLSEHVARSGGTLPPRSRESMERDLANLRFESKKFATAVNDVLRCVQERIQQWTDYENSLERLLLWLADAETSLKNYSLRNTMEEKQEQLERYQTLIASLKQHEVEFDRMSDHSSDLMQISGETRFSASVQQVTSRFQSIQTTARELVKKCEQASADHAAYLERYKQCSEYLDNTRRQYRSIEEDSSGSRQELTSKAASLRELLSRQSSSTVLLNSTVETGERLYPSTGPEGREIVRQQLLELQAAFEELYDGVASTERELHSKISRWSGFDECGRRFEGWLELAEAQLGPEIELQATLDEKRAQLQIYRNHLQEAQSHRQDLLDLRDKADSLPDRTDEIEEALGRLTRRHEAVLKRAGGFVERYEGIVSDHQQYSKAVLDTHEWLDATHNAVILWGDVELERVSLHTNLDRLRNLLHGLPEEEPRVRLIRVLGEKVIPGTLESGQVKVRSQMDSSQQEWEGLLTAVKSTIEALEGKLQQWGEFESSKERCLAWMRETDGKLHAVDLKASLAEKKEELEALRGLQGEIRAKELEIDSVTERGQQLLKGASSRAGQASELGIKYRQIASKVKDLNARWHQYVSTHQEFDNRLSECTGWLGEVRKKLAYCSDLGATSQRDLEAKMEIVRELLLSKEDGFAKVQAVVELAQAVLANTAPAGHGPINEALAELREQWSALASRMLEAKTNLDDSINKWAGLLEQIQAVDRSVEWAEAALNDASPFQASMSEKRCQLDRIKALEERIRCENIEVDGLKSRVAEMIASGPQGLAASRAQEILDRFDGLFERIKSLLAEREARYRDHRVYKEAQDDLIGWLNRAREKIPSMKQRSLSDKLAIENAVAPVESLLNKKAQGELLVEHLHHTAKVVCASTSPQGQETIGNDVRALTESFEGLFREIQEQKEQLERTVGQWRDYKDEYERLSDWLQQFDILVKAQKNALLPSVAEKERQVREVKRILEDLGKGQEQIDRFNGNASALLASHLDTYVNGQLRHLNSRYQVQINQAKDVLKKVETNLAQHQEYEANLGKCREWIEGARQIVRQGTEVASSSSREELQGRLDKIQELLRRREEGQNLVHLTVNCGEKVMRSTRSDGREEIGSQLKEIQNDWERLVKKISTTKVHLETSLLRWADYSSSYQQLQQWINDREAKLQQVCEQKVSKARKGLAGLSSLAIGERRANLRQTNSIVQDIVAFEPMIQSVTTKAEDLRQARPASEISIKYESLSKQARELYARQKETVEQHQAFIDGGNEFGQWIRAAKERLGKCSEPTGDKESLAGKITQLKVLQSELAEGQRKLARALEQGNAACQVADEEDKEIIEEEAALLQEEYDNYVDSLNGTKSLLEVAIVKWTEYEDQFSEAADWLTQTEQLVQSFNKLQDSLEEKKNVLERFQLHLQTLFDWQKELDRLNVKAQMLLETCADTRISNAITQLTTKYNALLSLAKEIMRRLELHYQEHQQHNTLYQECQDWIERTRDRLAECREIPSTLAEVRGKLKTCRTIRQSLEQGQNKLRYALELKERVIMNTEQNGAAKIQEDTENLKAEFERLLANVEEIRQRLSGRAGTLEELNKVHRLIADWLEEVEGKIQPGESCKNDLSEKRAALERCRAIQRDVQGHAEGVERLRARLGEDASIPPAPYRASIEKYEELRRLISEKVHSLEGQVREHERFQQAHNEATDWVRRTKLELQQYCDTHGERDRIAEREQRVGQIVSSLPKGEALLSKVIELSDRVLAETGPEGQEQIRQDARQLQADWKCLHAQCHNSQRTLASCIEAWARFDGVLDGMNRWTDRFQAKVAEERAKESRTPEDLARCKRLAQEAAERKPVLEELNDKCEALLEMSACNWARDRTVQLQSAYTGLLTEVQGLVSRAEKNLSDHTEFLKAKREMEDWLRTASGSVEDCVGLGDAAWARDKLETMKLVVTRITEGQHLLSVLQQAFARAIDTALPEQQEELRSVMGTLTSGWEQLNMDAKTVQAGLKSLLGRWEDHAEAYEKLSGWLERTDAQLRQLPDTKGELGDMRTMLERCKHLQEEIREKKAELDRLAEEAAELSELAKDEGATSERVVRLLTRWRELGEYAKERRSFVEFEMQEYCAYSAALQETEKWLLQISFQLMAHNSLYITSKGQTVEQIRQHEALLEEIEGYTATLSELRSKGVARMDRYAAVNPSIGPTIATQLENVQESYRSLVETAQQIRKRLAESLAKFEEYERTLESIAENLEEYERAGQRLQDSERESPDELDSAKRCLEETRALHDKLQTEKARLAAAVEACEAAVACVSRPGSPLDAPPVQIPARELEVRSKLEDLIDQMQTRLTGATAAVAELEEQARQRNALRAWITQQRAVCAEWRSRPAKLRSEAARAELRTMDELLASAGERRAQARAELSLREEADRDIEEGLAKLEAELIEALAGKRASQELIGKYRSQVQEMQAWLEGLAKRVDAIERGNGLAIGQKIGRAKEIASEFGSQGPARLAEVKSLGDRVMDSVSNLDSQQIEEQLRSVERRYADIGKKLQRKAQILDMTAQGIEATRREIEENVEWTRRMRDRVGASEPIGYESKQAEERLLALKGMLKEADGKQVVLEALERRVGNMQNELESSEQQELETEVKGLREERAELCGALRDEIASASVAAEARRKLESELARARAWIKSRRDDLKKLSGYLPLKASEVEREVAQHGGLEADIESFDEAKLKDVLKQGQAMLRECGEEDRARLRSLLEELGEEYEELKREAREKQAALADLLQGRRAFESEMSKCRGWIDEAEVATSSDLRTSSPDVLREQLAKYDRLKKEARQYADDIERVTEQGKSILPTISDADKLELGERLKSMREAHGRVASVIEERATALQRSIEEAEEAAARLAEAVGYTSEIQRELQELKRPIGARPDDVEAMLEAHERILAELKAKKEDLAELRSVNPADLHALLAQQDDLIRALEAQIAKLRQLLLLRQQFIALIAEITTFIAKYTEIVRDIERSTGQTTEEKIKRYDDVILKIQECEASLASATDKGQQIAAEGSAADRNSVTEQVQSLKQQLQGLRRAVEAQREQHELAAAEHARLAEELAEILRLLGERESEVRSRPLLQRDPASVEAELEHHGLLCEGVNEQLERIRELRGSIRHEEAMPGSLKEMLSEAASLLASLPREMEDRAAYLEGNVKTRLEYAALTDKLHGWVREAEIRLESGKEGLDLENILTDLEEHKIYFGTESTIRELVSQQIQQAADKIWPSLSGSEQEELGAEQQQHTQLLKNTLNTAKSRRARLEQGAETWRDYGQSLERVRASIARSKFTDEPVTTLAGLQFNIQKISHALNDVQNQQFELDLLNERGREVLRLADARNGKTIEDQLAGIASDWKELVSGLEGRRDALEALSKHWEELEARWALVEARINATEEKGKLLDMVVRSKQHLLDTLGSVDELASEAEKLRPAAEEAKSLAGPVLAYLAAFTEAPARALEDRLDRLQSSAEALIGSLRERSERTRLELKAFEAFEAEVEALRKRLNESRERASGLYVFGPDQEAAEAEVSSLRAHVEDLLDSAKRFSGSTKARYESSQQLVPSDLGHHLTALELCAEATAQAMEEKQREQKRARTTRSDYLTDLDEVQAWIRRAELMVQDRSVEPIALKGHLRQLQDELGPIGDKLERLTRNGRAIVENTADQTERELVESTIHEVTDQLARLKSWLEERKRAVGDTLDAWQRFLALHEAVKAWTEEKRQFLLEPLNFDTLVQARQRLHEYSTAVKSCKQVNKNLSDMGRELESIGQVTNVGELPEKLVEAEEAKVQVEAQLLERNAMLQETSEEWEQCERKMKEVRSWIEKARQALESAQNRKKPLRDQHGIREKMLSDVAIQKTKIAISMEKLRVHFRSGIGADGRIRETADELVAELEGLRASVKEQATALEACLAQIDQYQQEIQHLRQQIVQVEQQLRTVLSPTYLSNDRERALQEQQKCREEIRSLQSKIQARAERCKLLAQRGTPDVERLDPSQ